MGKVGAAQLCRKYEISPGLLYHWKRQYSLGKYDNEPTSEGRMMDRIQGLERMVGRLTMENELLKKAIRCSMQNAQNFRTSRNGSSLPRAGEELSSGGVRS